MFPRLRAGQWVWYVGVVLGSALALFPMLAWAGHRAENRGFGFVWWWIVMPLLWIAIRRAYRAVLPPHDDAAFESLLIGAIWMLVVLVVAFSGLPTL